MSQMVSQHQHYHRTSDRFQVQDSQILSAFETGKKVMLVTAGVQIKDQALFFFNGGLCCSDSLLLFVLRQDLSM